ncbi:MAG: glycosyl hydrolase [Spirochaetales bacterium]|nr:glycosyl hydrolase [Spirochaetales bacterium]
MTTIKDLILRLNSSEPAYRSAPFWAWNDSLAPDRLTEQMDGMREQGIRGFFIHSREGLETEYLSQEWMDCAEKVTDHAGKTEMEVWIYDEDTWPSGSAGGSVSASDPEQYTAAGLTIELLSLHEEQVLPALKKTLVSDHRIIAIYSAEVAKDLTEIRSFDLIPLPIEEPLPAPEGKVLIFRLERSASSEWYNGSAPSDNLNPKAVRQFLNTTHEAYAGRLSQHFGSVIKGFFTDEPNICDFFARFTNGLAWLPWSSDFPRIFKEKRGYSVLEILPLLFFDTEGSEKARYDYWLTMTELFVSSYTKQIYDWCSDKDLMLTGHMLYENDLGYGVRCNGAVMPHYRYMHAPGIDLLGDQRQEYLTVKQCTSVANQFRRERVVSEMYGCTGWDFSFAGQKRLGDWQFIMGVTQRCQHLALYSISGCRKRDYPPAFNYQSTWWKYSQLLEEYFQRLGACTTTGTVFRDILMIHPVGSFWMKSGSTLNEDLSKVYMNMGWLDKHFQKLNREGDYYNKLTEQLLRHHYDFDFGDELIMKEVSRVRGRRIQVGEHSYSQVIVPPLETLMESTAELLLQFLDAGGQVCWMTPLPSRLDARDSDRLRPLIRHENSRIAGGVTELRALLSDNVKRPVRVQDSFGKERSELLSMTRNLKDGQVVTVTNTSDRTLDDVDLIFSTYGKVTALDPLTGNQSSETIQIRSTGEMILKKGFAPEETKIFLIDNTENPETAGELPLPYRHPHDAVDLVYGFPLSSPVTLTSENALTLDRCSFRISDSDEDWSREMPVWKAQKVIREGFGMQSVYYNGAPQRYLWIDRDKAYPVSLRFTFHVETLPEEAVYAAVEKSQQMTVRCNGELCSPAEAWFLDKDIQTHRISSLQAGLNTLIIDVPYTSAAELEDVYITGRFGVSPERRITEYPEKLKRGDWTLQGLKHYPGSCIYRYTVPELAADESGRPLFLKIGSFKGALAVIRINGQEPVYVLRESSLPVDTLIIPGTETNLEIEIVGDLRNTLGPLHRSASVCSRISWEDFHPSGPACTEDYVTEPMGLMGEVYLHYRN